MKRKRDCPPGNTKKTVHRGGGFDEKSFGKRLLFFFSQSQIRYRSRQRASTEKKK